MVLKKNPHGHLVTCHGMYISHGEMVINSSPFISWMVMHLLIQIQVPEATNSKFLNDHSKEEKRVL